ncbi:hypothetical protein LLEC1_07390, partial [Akanthomyces lecanii]
MNYAHNFQATHLVHRPAKTSIANLKPPKPKAASHARGLDADELTRRLQFVIAERKAHDDKKRRPLVVTPSSRPFRTQETSSEVKAALEEQLSADPAASDGPYVPRVAATQFADTTIGDSPPDKSHIHKLSRAALKYHMDGVNGDLHVASTAVPGAAPIEQAKALRRAQTLRERNYDRNQFQASSMPENLDPAILSRRRSIFAAHTSEEKRLRDSRRKSTGSVLGTDASPPDPIFLPPINSTDLAAIAEAHRVDWTQSDEP